MRERVRDPCECQQRAPRIERGVGGPFRAWAAAAVRRRPEDADEDEVSLRSIAAVMATGAVTGNGPAPARTIAASECPSAATLAMAPAMALTEVTERSFATVGAAVVGAAEGTGVTVGVDVMGAGAE